MAASGEKSQVRQLAEAGGKKAAKVAVKKAGKAIAKKVAVRVAAGAVSGGTAAAALLAVDALRAAKKIGVKTIKTAGKVLGSFIILAHMMIIFSIAAVGTTALSLIVVVPVAFVIIFTIINTGALVVPPSDVFSPFSPQGQFSPFATGSQGSRFIDATKQSLTGNVFENEDLPLRVNYEITITATEENLTNISIEDNCQAINADGSFECPQFLVINTSAASSFPSMGVPLIDTEVAIPDQIITGNSLTFEVAAEFDERYADSIVTNTVRVTADSESASGETSFAATSIIIGEAPACPGPIWPVTVDSGQTYFVNQGPGGSASHGPPARSVISPVGVPLPPYEAIDIHPVDSSRLEDKLVIATHPGIVIGADKDELGGKFVKIRATCGLNFVSQYVHMETLAVSDGDIVNVGTELGNIGMTGFAASVHVHYEFRDLRGGFRIRPGIAGFPSSDPPPYMIVPFIPKEVPFGCVGRGNCGVDIP